MRCMRRMPRQAPAGRGAPPLAPRVAELRALAHPLRLRILELFAEQPRTTKQVAGLLDQPPTRLYHHVAALERAGLLRLTETRKNRGTTEKWYVAVARAVSATGAAGTRSRAGAAARRALAMTVLEQSRQEVVSAMQRRGAEPPLLARIVVVTPPERVEALRQRLYEVVKQVAREFECETEPDAPPPRDADVERWAMTMTLAPVSSTRL